MTDTVRTYGDATVLLLDPAGPPIAERRDVIDMIGDAASHSADLVAIPVERQSDDFFDLKTRIAGEMLQVCVTYGIRIAFVGDLSERMAASGALRDFVRESNRGNQVWFVEDIDALARKLGGQPEPALSPK